MQSSRFFGVCNSVRVRRIENCPSAFRLFLCFVGAGVAFSCGSGQVAYAQSPDATMQAKTAQQETGHAQEGVFKFDVLEFEVAGNTVLEPSEIQRVLTPYLGFDRTIADIDAARAALEGFYKEQGYITVVVDVPEQSVIDAVLRLEVTEGRVDRLMVTGAEYNRPALIKEAVPSLREGAVPNLNDVRPELSDVNSVSGREVTPVFRAGMAPGTVDVDLAVNDEKPWGAALELNDQYNGSTSRLRLAASVQYDNLFQANHNANLLFQTSPQDFSEIRVFSGSYFMPVSGPDLGVVVYGLVSNTDVATVDGITVLGEGFTLGGRAVISLDSAGDFIQSFIVGLDFKDFEDSVSIDEVEESFDLPVSYLPFTAQYQSILAGDKATTQFNLGATFAFDNVVGDGTEFAAIRNEAEASFIYLYGGASHNRLLTDSGLMLTGELDFQLAPAPLIANEQFAVGGVQSVRGFRQAEALGDSGVRGSIQLTHPLPGVSLLPDAIRNAVENWKVFAFIDGGYVASNAQLEGDPNNVTIGGCGAGTTFDVLGGLLSVRADIAYQINDNPTGRAEVDSDFGDFRVHFSISANY